MLNAADCRASYRAPVTVGGGMRYNQREVGLNYFVVMIFLTYKTMLHII